MSKAKILVPVIGASGLIFLIFWLTKIPVTYDECMVKGMRNQPQIAYPNVHRHCLQESKKEFQVFLSNDQIEWHSSLLSIIVYTKYDGSESYITRGEFEISPKLCSESNKEDFSVSKIGVADEDGSFLIKLENSEFSTLLANPQCMRTLSLWARYF